LSHEPRVWLRGPTQNLVTDDRRARRADQQEGSKSTVGEIIMTACAKGVIDTVAPSTRGSALKATNLRDKARVIEQFNLAAIQRSQDVAIDVALGLSASSYVTP
jgi:hypothetical protein